MSTSLKFFPARNAEAQPPTLRDKLPSVLRLNPWLIHAAAGMFVPTTGGGRGRRSKQYFALAEKGVLVTDPWLSTPCSNDTLILASS